METIEPGVNRLMPVLNKTTEEILMALSFHAAAPLLSGTHLVDFLECFGTEVPARPLYGLYFLFYVEQEVVAPLYVGKGKIPGRLLQHFGQGQHIDQMLASHTGGRHYYAVHFSKLTRGAYNKGLETIAVRFLIDDKDACEQDEKSFIRALRPIANHETYLRQRFHDSADGYDLGGLAKEWRKTNGAQPLEDRFKPILDKFSQ